MFRKYREFLDQMDNNHITRQIRNQSLLDWSTNSYPFMETEG